MSSRRGRHALSFRVLGVPRPAGSKRAVRHRETGRIVILDASGHSRDWKGRVADAAAEAMSRRGGLDLLDGPLRMRIVFVLPRPKGHYGRRGIRPSAPEFPAIRPDIDKLSRAILDALSGIVYRDDAQIVSKLVEKRYGDPARAQIRIEHVAQTTEDES